MSAAEYREPAGREGGPPPVLVGPDFEAALARARSAFEPNPEWAYLDTATGGLPPRRTLQLMARIEREWQRGDVDWYRWDTCAETARADFATFIGASAAEIALIPSISIGVGFVMASLAPQAEVLLPTDEYSSVILPALVAAQRRGICVREVPFDRLTDEIRPTTTLVAASSVQMHTGRAPDLPALISRCRDTGARLLLDASQGVPFQDLAPHIEGVDFLVAATYKHLLSPRGSSFLFVRRDRWDEVGPDAANSRGAAPDAFYLGGPLRLKPDAGRFDTSLAWLPWAATAESLRLLREWREQGLFREVRRLTDRLVVGLGLPSPPASLVCLPLAHPEAAMSALRQARVRAAIRVGHVRLAPHLWTTDADVDRALEALRPFAAPEAPAVPAR